MKVRCISNSGRDLSPSCLRPSWGFTWDKEFPLVIGKTYQVYAFTLVFGHVWYYICDETYSHYPVWTPSLLFELVDGRVSSFWQLGFLRGNISEEPFPIIAFKEWVEDSTFYDRLTDGQPLAVETFRQYKKLLDEEYTNRAMG